MKKMVIIGASGHGKVVAHTDAVIAEEVMIGKGTVIMAGAVVVKNIEEAGTYVGVPVGRKCCHES